MEMTSVQAAVLREENGAFQIEELQLAAPRELEVLVRIVATGMCHTDAAVRSRDIGTPLPVVVGHEGAGVVVAVGSAVRKVAPGDHVVLTFNSCGQCAACLSGELAKCELSFPLNLRGARLDGSHALQCAHGEIHDQFFGQSAFATYALAQERNTVKVPHDVPLELLGPLGCGIMTGSGAVLNSLRVGPGQSLVVFGSGAVGLAAVMAARVAGATTIIAVDIVTSRLDLALELGATHVIDSHDGDLVARIMDITGNGADFTLDTTGRADVMQMAVAGLRIGGTCGILGVSPPGTSLAIDTNLFIGMSRQLRGILAGDSVPDVFIPQLIALYRQGRFPFDRLIRFYTLADINQALADSEAGIAIKPVVRVG